MASPWKFLSRGVTATRAKAGQWHGRRHRRDPSDIAAVEPAPTDEAENEAYDRVGSVGADVAAVGGSASSDDTHIAVITAHDAGETGPVAEGDAPKQRSRGKNNNPAVVLAQVAPSVHAASNDTMSLDQEIRALRGQLAIKLQVQNAQLKKMLERFER